MQEVSILRRFAHQPMLRWDPPSTSQYPVSASGDPVIQFGRFCILPRARQLLLDGQPVELGSRAFDLLMVLIGAPGALVTKKEIFSCVWPSAVVEEANLKVQMSALRKVLSRDRGPHKNRPRARLCVYRGGLRGISRTGRLGSAQPRADTVPTRTRVDNQLVRLDLTTAAADDRISDDPLR